MIDMLKIPDIKEILESADGGAASSPDSVSARDLMDKVDESVREPLANYLSNCPAMWVSQSIEDPLDPSKGYVVPTGIATDGVWVWRIYWGYFVGEYGAAVPEDFLTHAQSQNFEPVVLSEEEMDRVIDRCQEQWPA
ncbi:hypothetical protein [Nocardia sp. NPDC019395]|uniref:hypothetical protein n=1 Tax=Nocardia sp. NPDC019395 TaxID=3154686 RepID=UPI0033D95F18